MLTGKDEHRHATADGHGQCPRVPRAARPTLVITVDGCDPRYLDDALARGLMPRLAEMLDAGGAYALGRSQMPSFTNTNNMSIVTGAPPVGAWPARQPLSRSRRETKSSSAIPAFLRAPSIHKVLMDHGARVLCVTAKDKLRRLLAHGGRAGDLGREGAPVPAARLWHRRTWWRWWGGRTPDRTSGT